jgi:hypothetical protein
MRAAPVFLSNRRVKGPAESTAMADTHTPDLDMSNAREPAPPSEERENRRLALTTVWLVMALLAAIIVGTFLVVSHQGHATALTPGQPQKPAAAILGGSGG